MARDHPVGVATTGAAADNWKKDSLADGVETISCLGGPGLFNLPTAADALKHGAPTPAKKEQLVPEESGCKDVRHKLSHKKKDLAKLSLSHAGPITTLMIRNIPCSITQRQLAEVVAELGYGGKFDLLFMPTPNRPSASANSNLGYGFVNFTHAADAESFAEAIEGYRFQGTASVKVCTAQPAHVQGFDGTLDQLMHLKKRSKGTFMCSL
mmetsp:Transcript_107276/g.298840  ORF Transcript_107276/g.298840 Transcript_107276/m.298840 type:complete len:210 (+) Transcript_107276:2-631(+)